MVVTLFDVPVIGDVVVVMIMVVAEEISRLAIFVDAAAVLVSLNSVLVVLELLADREIEVELLVIKTTPPLLVADGPLAFVITDVLMPFRDVEMLPASSSEPDTVTETLVNT